MHTALASLTINTRARLLDQALGNSQNGCFEHSGFPVETVRVLKVQIGRLDPRLAGMRPLGDCPTHSASRRRQGQATSPHELAVSRLSFMTSSQ